MKEMVLIKIHLKAQQNALEKGWWFLWRDWKVIGQT